MPISNRKLRVGAILLACSLAVTTHAQTPDLSAVVEQLNALQAQVNAVREENAALRKQLGVVETKTTKVTPASPVTGIKLGGELRLRYESFHDANDAFIDRNRFRFRLRFGGTADLPHNVEVGLRLTTGVNEGEPTGNNSTMQDNASKKSFALDLAYAKWTMIKQDATTLAVIGGKMNSPFTSSDFVFDGDYTPEGLAAQFSRKLTAQHTLRANGALFVIDELAATSHDPYFYGAQLRLDSIWNKQWSTTFGVTRIDISSPERLVNSAVPDVHKGNTRTVGGALVNDYRPWLVDAGVTVIVKNVPVRLCGDYMTNPGAKTNNHAYYGGLYLGKAAKRGTWEFNYRYRVAQADCWYEELIDSDSGAFYQAAPAGGSVGYGGGTNVRGHIFAGNYAVADYAMVGFTLYVTRLINPNPVGSESGMGRLQVNTIVKF